MIFVIQQFLVFIFKSPIVYSFPDLYGSLQWNYPKKCLDLQKTQFTSC